MRRSKGTTDNRRHAFTLIELLAVIGIIGILFALLLPTLNKAHAAANATRCAAQLRAVYGGISAYAQANAGYVHRAPNEDRWINANALIAPSSARAYWGVAYFPYLVNRSVAQATGIGAADEILIRARSLFLCPSAKIADTSFGNTELDRPVSYGINHYLTVGKVTYNLNASGLVAPTVAWPKFHKLRPASSVIVAHDAYEARLEDKDADTLSSYGEASNLSAWRGTPGAVDEYFRHNRRSNVLWLDGHVSPVAESNGNDVPKEWYEGVLAR